MNTVHFAYLSSLSQEGISSLDDVLINKRLVKHLWIEFILNPDAVKAGADYLHEAEIRTALTDALSWHLAFRWLLPENAALLELKEKNVLSPYSVKLNIYQKHRRNFLKGILHAGLC